MTCAGSNIQSPRKINQEYIYEYSSANLKAMTSNGHWVRRTNEMWIVGRALLQQLRTDCGDTQDISKIRPWHCHETAELRSRKRSKPVGS